MRRSVAVLNRASSPSTISTFIALRSKGDFCFSSAGDTIARSTTERISLVASTTFSAFCGASSAPN
ncbi:hypothetical protein [Novosphingobium sp. SG707]|uniref:hypothetical protein n=1 Tax=Novosphingobium sp. SG707 TaxID=2586996 RepID=UPI00144773C4|nr:hypothetical protein [Novosphingobium sp. SG707]